MKKRRFSPSERYAIWSHHQKRCWLCKEPLRLFETTIDHVLPESLLFDVARRDCVLEEYGLAADFNINGFENWLPCHAHCNQAKGSTTTSFVPGNRFILDQLIKLSPLVAQTAEAIRANAAKDDLLARIMVGLERQTINILDVEQLVADFGRQPDLGALPAMIQLDNGYWLREDDVAREGTCCCERAACVDSQGKIHCFFSRTLPAWVISKGLYWKCYDEVIRCPRCDNMHKRGHVGREDVCGRPYLQQVAQCD